MRLLMFQHNSAGAWERGSALYTFAAEMRELQASLHSSFPLLTHTNDTTTTTATSSDTRYSGSAGAAPAGAMTVEGVAVGAAASVSAVKPTVETTTTPPCIKFAGTSSNARKPWQGPVNCGVYARAFRCVPDQLKTASFVPSVPSVLSDDGNARCLSQACLGKSSCVIKANWLQLAIECKAPFLAQGVDAVLLRPCGRRESQRLSCNRNV